MPRATTSHPPSVANPRRSSRLPVRGTARIAVVAESFVSTELLDLGEGGCQVEAPRPVPAGARVYLHVRGEDGLSEAALTGRIAWVSAAAPWRAGVAFDDDTLNRLSACELAAALERALPRSRGAPFVASIPLAARVAPTPAPGTLRARSEREEALLRAVGDGVRVEALRDALGPGWPACRNALFALVARGALVVSPADA
jgi:hypothetical protein